MRDLTVSLIQTTLHWENPEANIRMMDEKTDALKELTQLIILPEMFSTGFSMNPGKFAGEMDGSAVKWMLRKAQKKCVAITGSLMIQEEGHYYNRLLWVLPNGQTGQYDKKHLFAYGNEASHYTAGNKRLVAQLNGWRICLNICYDLRFPVWSRQSGNPGSTGNTPEYDILVYVANWPAERSLAWNTLLQARAIENQCYVIGVNRVGTDGNGLYYDGDSSIIGPLGEILFRKSKEEITYTHTLSSKHLEDTRQKFPFLRDATNFLIL